MRKVLVASTAALLALWTAAPAVAGVAGLPELGKVKVGQVSVTIRSANESLAAGANILTLEFPPEGLPADAQVTVRLVKGQQVITAAAKPIQMLSEGEGAGVSVIPPAALTLIAATGGDPHSHDPKPAEPAPAPKTESAPAEAHGQEAGSTHEAGGHDAAATEASHEEDSHGGGHGDEHGLAGPQYRARFSVPEAGEWALTVSIAGVGESAPLHVETIPGGPNRIFMSVVGLLMGSAAVAGAVHRLMRSKKEAK